jgi:hypothetical protein
VNAAAAIPPLAVAVKRYFTEKSLFHPEFLNSLNTLAKLGKIANSDFVTISRRIKNCEL